MTRTIRILWQDNKLLVAGFVLAIVVMVFFAVRNVVFWIYWADPAHRNQVPEPWMTPRYVAHSWHVSPEVVAEALGLTAGGRRVTLEEIAARDGISVEELADQLIAAIETHRETRKGDDEGVAK